MQVGQDSPQTVPSDSPPSSLPIRPLLLSVPGPAEPSTTTTTAASPQGYSGWTLVMICIGISMIACCVMIPQIDENRRQLYQCEKLAIDLEHLKKQVDLNDQFIGGVGRDPALAERLALRQMKYIRKGTSVLDLKGIDPGEQRSPFSLVNLAPPPPLPPYEPVKGKLAELCRDSKNRLYMIGGGLLLLAIGLVLGSTEK